MATISLKVDKRYFCGRINKKYFMEIIKINADAVGKYKGLNSQDEYPVIRSKRSPDGDAVIVMNDYEEEIIVLRSNISVQ